MLLFFLFHLIFLVVVPGFSVSAIVLLHFLHEDATAAYFLCLMCSASVSVSVCGSRRRVLGGRGPAFERKHTQLTE